MLKLTRRAGRGKQEACHRPAAGLIISYQSHEGHTILDSLTDEEVRTKFDELTGQGLTGFADTKIDMPVNVRTVDEALEMGAKEIFFPARLRAG